MRAGHERSQEERWASTSGRESVSVIKVPGAGVAAPLHEAARQGGPEAVRLPRERRGERVDT